ncbi:MAG: LCP family protein [Ktedonobacteraceae bacterium]|nr:LCP family protein [Ktedonobacteraceae bacterium]
MDDNEPTIKLPPAARLRNMAQGEPAPASSPQPSSFIYEEPTAKLPQVQAYGIADQPTAQMPRVAPTPPFARPLPTAFPAPGLPGTGQEGRIPMQPAPMPVRPQRGKRKRLPRGARVTLLVILVLLILGGGFAAAYAYFYIQQPLSAFVHPVSRDKNEPGSSNVAPADLGSITGRSWNILLLASDNDQKYTFPALLTQVMMVVHVDTVSNKVTLVSIPRDSWVYVPEVGSMHKIDQAFFLGATQHNSFDDGVRLARLSIEKDYGITIDRYAWVGLDGFSRVIDTLGGITIDVTHPIVDDTYPDDTGTHAHDPYAFKRLYVAPGAQHLNGQQALEYVRSRHADLVGDIGRTQRQQQVLEALKRKLNVQSILAHLPQLIKDLTGKVYTDLSEQEMIAFANYGRSLSNSAIQRLTLGPGTGDQNYGTLQSVYDPSVHSNQDVLIPNCSTIQPVINRIFALGNAQSCNVIGP